MPKVKLLVYNNCAQVWLVNGAQSVMLRMVVWYETAQGNFSALAREYAQSVAVVLGCAVEE